MSHDPTSDRRPSARRSKARASRRELFPIDAMGSPKSSRVSGIYQEGQRFRVVAFCPERRSFWCSTRAEADAIAERLTQMFRQQSACTVGQAVEEYLEYLRQQGQRNVSLRNLRYKLLPFLPAERMLHTITAEVAAELYQAETQRTTRFLRPMAAASHRASLKYARALFRWLVEDRKYLQSNPFEHVKPIGRVNTGKHQLRLDEARKLHAWLLKQAEHDERATAVLTQLILGLRSAELLRRQVRDVDDHGQLFCIESGKTKNARRWLEIRSPALQALLAKQAQGRGSEDLLFGGNRATPHEAPTLWKWLRSFCEAAGVPLVCPHSLRGLHSTLALEHGATSGLVAAALGHGSFAVTQRHYVRPGTMTQLKQSKMAAALEGPAPEAPAEAAAELAQLTNALSGLPPEQLAQLLRTVGIVH